ncbi:peptidase [Massilia phyllosphaerae]|uniref:peptidase n=1 Tax=Massilia phyllosphaerae TaxID=3106034 RepID=UPI002B1CCD59|nr:peptidase [Massilia sp. SGZ-792]
MTYCVGMRLEAGLVFLADSRTNAGIDQVSTARKLSVFENPGERMMALMTAGNLSISQAVRQTVSSYVSQDGTTIWTAPTMYEAARIVGEAVRSVHKEDAAKLTAFGVDFNISLIFGGQIGAERCRLFYIYSAGNFIESHDENPYFQIGEAKYGKPILDRVITPQTSLDDAAKCALVSMDSTLRSNVAVGLPLDLLVYENGSLALTRFVTIDEQNQYFQRLRIAWGQQLKAVFEGIDAPVWDAAPAITDKVPSSVTPHSRPVRVPLPAGLTPLQASKPLQSLAEQPALNTQH